MKYRNLVLISLVVMLLAGCSAGGPSNSEVEEVVYGLYFNDASILEKRPCELTPRMEEEGQTNVWYVRYKFKDSGTEGVMLISEGDTEEYPWVPYMALAGMTENAIQENCP